MENHQVQNLSDCKHDHSFASGTLPFEELDFTRNPLETLQNVTSRCERNLIARKMLSLRLICKNQKPFKKCMTRKKWTLIRSFYLSKHSLLQRHWLYIANAKTACKLSVTSARATMSPEHHLATTQESLESTRELLSFYGEASSDFYDCSSAQLVWSSRVHLLAMPSCRPFSLNFELYDHPSHRFLTFKTSEVSASFASSKNNRKYQVHFSQFLPEERRCILQLVFIYKLISARLEPVPKPAFLLLILRSVLSERSQQA